ncbi:reverse transcriptase [Corchorus capsularis]|uniref:Reverse transcriptase n=1 Tax=Corchorus capsularis TaxID=210143 RepID=A0A1R3GAR9_COCAP|nr:reverse transcriptase [Corchorus capsularis]
MEDLVLDLEVASDPEMEKVGWSVLGKIASEKPLNKGVVKAILGNLWPEKDVPIIGDVGSNLVNLIFTFEEVMNRALTKNPWSMMGYYLNLKYWPPDKAIREVDLDSIAFWVQIHSLPREMMMKSNAMKIGSSLGKVIEIEEPRGRFGINRSFLRVRVESRAENPLVPVCWVNRPGGDRAWAEFNYEKLSDFCFNCGRLGHTCKFCRSEVAVAQRFGPFMRAPMAKQLLSPGKQRSISWDGRKKPWECDWHLQKVARGFNVDPVSEKVVRGLNFDHASEKARGVDDVTAKALGTQNVTLGIASGSFGDAKVGPNMPAQQPASDIRLVDTDVTMGVSRRSADVATRRPAREQAVPEADYPDEPGVPELDYPETTKTYEPDSPEIYESGSQDIVNRRKLPNLSPVKMIRTVMNLSNVFHSLHLKRGAGDDIDLKDCKKKQKVVGLLNPDHMDSDCQTIDLERAQEKEVLCLGLGKCVPQTKRKYKRKAGVRGRGRKANSAVVIRELEDPHEVPITQASLNSVVRALKGLKRNTDPGWIFLMETKNNSVKVDNLGGMLGYDNAFYVEPAGLSGGLAIWWKKGIDIRCPVDFEDRQRLYQVLVERITITEGLVLCMGDFNDILTPEGKKGGATLHLVLPKGQPAHLANGAWLQCFPDAQVFNQPAIGSDHLPIRLDTTPEVPKAKRYFKFEAMWVDNLNCEELAKIQSGEEMDNSSEDLHKIVKKIDEALENEERYWFQRSRVKWTLFGDQNTAFFHQTTLQRRQRNKILRVKDSNGVWLEDEAFVINKFSQHFRNLFSSDTEYDWRKVISHMPQVITEDINKELTQPILEEEVKWATFEMGAHKAPCPDGFFHGGFMLRELNRTNIVLIPKVASPEEVSDYRPISLCNFAYKIISKILANRLKKWLDLVITQNQNAFIANRQIQDNILIAQEVFHHLRLKKKRKRCELALKLDLNKAYNRVEWGFLEAVLLKLGFCRKWVSWIMQCISTVSYTLVMNGRPAGEIVPSRGLRQGDPLSPYLFLVVVDVLSRMIQDAIDDGSVKGIKLSKHCPVLSHLFFADDALLFMEARVQNCQKVAEIIEKFCKASGQRVNLLKSSAIFSLNTSDQLRNDIAGSLGITVAQNPGTYLGIPGLWGKTRKEVLSVLKSRILSRIQGWKQKLLSQGGREVLIKVVVSAIPTYLMACFKCPKTFCQEINSAVAKFWWGQLKEESKIHWGNKPRDCLRMRMLFGPVSLKVYIFLIPLFWRLKRGPDPPGLGATFWRVEISSKNIFAGRLEMGTLQRSAEKEAISNVPRSRCYGNDNVIWPNDKSGDHSVKTGYYTIRSGRRIQIRPLVSSSHTIDNQVWKIIWALCEKKVRTDLLCPICRDSPETVEHLLLTCEWVQGVWFGCFDYRISKKDVTTFDDWLVEVCKSARENFSKIWRGHLSSRATTNDIGKPPDPWYPPEPGWIKVNGDVAFNPASDEPGWIKVNGDGAFNPASDEERKVIFETDSAELVAAINGGKKKKWTVEPFLQDFRELTKDLAAKRVSLVHRLANVAADWLAKSVSQGKCPSGRVSASVDRFIDPRFGLGH